MTTPDPPDDDKCQISVCQQTHFTYCPHCKLFVCIKHLNEHYSNYKQEYQTLLNDGKQQQILNKQFIDDIEHEKKQLLPFDQKAYAKDFQERYDNDTIISSSTSQQYTNTTINSLISNRLKNQNENHEYMSDIEGQTDPDGGQSETDKEEIRQTFGISHALETFDDYKDVLLRDHYVNLYHVKEIGQLDK